MTERNGDGPLAGLRVIEMAGIGPGPFAAMLLADLGADVIRVDRPADSGGTAMTSLVNRGKRSVILDLKRPAAVEAALALITSADALIEGYRPGVTERLGIGPEDCWARNPRLVYGRMTGWGQSGPLAHAAGHDIAYIALTGALHAIGERGGPPQIPVNLLGDFGGGATYLVIGILAAIREAKQTGRGQVVDAAIVDGTAHLLTAIHAALASGSWTDERGVNRLDGGVPFYSVYATADGKYMAVGALEPKFYAELVRLLGLDEDPAKQHDREHWPELREQFTAAFATRTQAEWTQVFDGSDACVAPVLSLREASLHPHIASRGTLAEVGGVLQAAPAPRLSGAHPGPPPRVHEAVPKPGEHTREVLTAAGVTDLDLLIHDGVAVQLLSPPSDRLLLPGTICWR
jgi:alpha-methylacyl-CoA racemase